MPDGKAVDAGQSASHVGCISNSQATRSDDESRSVVEGRAHHDDDEERPRRLTVEPSMLGYTRGIRCRIASSRRRTMTCSRRKSRRPEEELGDDEARAVPDGEAVDAKQNASHVCCVPHSERLETMTRVAASTKDEPITATMKSAHDA